MANANLFFTPQNYANGILMNIGDVGVITRHMNLDYHSEFGQKAGKPKPGITIYVNKPQRFLGTTSTVFSKEALKNIQTSITVDKTFGIHTGWDMVEKTMKVYDANEKYFKPRGLKMASKINQDAAEFCALNALNIVGTPGVAPGAGGSDTAKSTAQVYQTAGDLLYEAGLPKGEKLACIVTRRMSSLLASNFLGLFGPSDKVASRYNKGEMDPTGLGYEWSWQNVLYSMTAGAFAGSGQVDGVQVADDGDNGDMTLTLKNLTASTTGNAGDWFAIAGVNRLEPLSKVPTGQLKQFRVNKAWQASGGGAVTLNISPAITPTGPYQNVDAAPADSAAVLFDEGTTGTPALYAGTALKMGLLLHKDAFAFVSVPYEKPESEMGAKTAIATDPDTGVSLMITKAFDPVGFGELFRADSLYGFGWLYRELACVING